MSRYPSAYAIPLAPGETLLWSGTPASGIRPSWGQYVIPVGAIVLIWTVLGGMNWSDGGRVVLTLVLAIWFGGALVKDTREAEERRDTFYALTNRRAIRFSPGRDRATVRVDLRHLHAVRVTEGHDLIGTVWCVPLFDQGWPKKNKRGESRPLFRLIVEPRRVADMLQEAQRELNPARPAVA